MKQGDIILVPFPFSNLKSIKTRPALVISNKKYQGDDILICGISSVSSKKQEITLLPIDIAKGDLPIKSFIKYGKIVCLHKKIVKKTVATISKTKIKKVVEEINKLIKA